MNGKKIPAYHLVQVHKQAMRVRGFIRPSLVAARDFSHKHRLATYGTLGVLAIGVGAGTAALQSSMMTDGSSRTTLTASTSGSETNRGGQVITTSPGKAEQSSQTTSNAQAAPAQSSTASPQPSAQSRPAESSPAVAPATTSLSKDTPANPGMALTVQQQDYVADQPTQKFYLKLNRASGYAAKVTSVKTKVTGNSITCDMTAQNGDVYELTCSRPNPVPSGSTESGTMTVVVTTDAGDNFAASTTYRLPLPS